jgi:hypothetical protein
VIAGPAFAQIPPSRLRMSPLPPGPGGAFDSVCVMKVSERYLAQAETVMRLAARADSPAEREVYLSIAEGWRRLATEVLRHEVGPEARSFKPVD